MNDVMKHHTEMSLVKDKIDSISRKLADIRGQLREIANRKTASIKCQISYQAFSEAAAKKKK